jgi:hypothetical protein
MFTFCNFNVLCVTEYVVALSEDSFSYWTFNRFAKELERVQPVHFAALECKHSCQLRKEKSRWSRRRLGNPGKIMRKCERTILCMGSLGFLLRLTCVVADEIEVARLQEQHGTSEKRKKSQRRICGAKSLRITMRVISNSKS